MQNLYRYSSSLITDSDLRFKRYLFNQIDWNDRLIGITGARGIGKTTLLLQHIKQSFGTSEEALYVSLDNFYFLKKSLFELAEEFSVNGGKFLFIDEVHRYPTWSSEIKNIYETFRNLKIVFSGSSALQIFKAEGDLSRRASMYKLSSMSLREYIELAHNVVFQSYTLSELLEHHIDIASEITTRIKPLPIFKDYLKGGSYPFYLGSSASFHQRLLSTVNVIIENDLMAIEHFSYTTLVHLRRLLALIADSVPFKPNISELSRKTGISRDILLRLIDLLEKSELLISLRQDSSPTGYLTKPEKIYLNNTSLLYSLTLNQNPETGTLRETFFVNQLRENHLVNLPKKGDFIVEGKFVFEVGGRNKTAQQIADLSEAFIVQDDIEVGYRNRIPLWLFVLGSISVLPELIHREQPIRVD
jgi:predicted AAA+ superfamily ATPase